jgi:hypothetical protein
MSRCARCASRLHESDRCTSGLLFPEGLYNARAYWTAQSPKACGDTDDGTRRRAPWMSRCAKYGCMATTCKRYLDAAISEARLSEDTRTLAQTRMLRSLPLILR